MKFILKKRMKWILKNPVYYLGGIVLGIFVIFKCYDYLHIHYFSSDSEIVSVMEDEIGDADIMHGYIPMTDKDKYDVGIKNLKNDLIEVIGVEANSVEDFLERIEGKNIEDSLQMIQEEYPFLSNVENYFYISEAKIKASVNEANSYITSALNTEDFTDYLGRKYSDYLGVGLSFYCLILFAFFYNYDYKKDVYELLHTKQICGWKYLLGKTLASFFVVVFMLVIITSVFSIILIKAQLPFPIHIYKIWKYVFVCNVPIVMYISVAYLLITGIFRTQLPTIPILFIQLLYSNSGVNDTNGIYYYVPKIGTILIRFPEMFFETNFSSSIYVNQIILSVVSLCLFLLSVKIWNTKQIG